jgi:formate hydrogenlyase subunit 3/multisubunit Na+/H+ antiporter MnhD subunit
MASVIFIFWLLFVVALLILNFGNVVLFLFIRNRIRRKSIEGEDIAMLILGIICVAGGIALYTVAPDKNTQLKMFYEMKPTCQEETVKCLSSKAKWYRDSVEYKVESLKKDDTAIIDSLKNIVNQYEK